jgi:hypothetical protein
MSQHLSLLSHPLESVYNGKRGCACPHADTWLTFTRQTDKFYYLTQDNQVDIRFPPAYNLPHADASRGGVSQRNAANEESVSAVRKEVPEFGLVPAT